MVHNEEPTKVFNIYWVSGTKGALSDTGGVGGESNHKTNITNYDYFGFGNILS